MAKKSNSGKGSSQPVANPSGKEANVLSDSGRRAHLAEMWRMWLGPVLGLGFIVAAAVVYMLDWVSDLSFAWFEFVIGAAVCWLLPAAMSGLRHPAGQKWRVVSFALGIAWAGLAGWTLAAYIAPGAADVHADMALGATVALPPEVTGSGFRVTVNGTEALAQGGAEAGVRYSLAVQSLQQPPSIQWLNGTFSIEDRVVSGRRGRTGNVHVVHAIRHHSLSWPHPEGATLHLGTLEPKGSERLVVDVRAGLFPTVWLLIGQGLLLLLALIVDGLALRRDYTTLLPHAGLMALIVQLQLDEALTPAAPAKPVFVVLLTSLVAGAVGGALLQWWLRRRLKPRLAVGR